MGGVQWSWTAGYRTRKAGRWPGLPALTCVGMGRPLTTSELVSLPVKWTGHLLCLLSGLKRENNVKWLKKALKQGLANYGLWAKSGPPLVFINKFY